MITADNASSGYVINAFNAGLPKRSTQKMPKLVEIIELPPLTRRVHPDAPKAKKPLSMD
ncbi:MAG TPA: hypothetical protein V6D22_05495 [Candidatus Obscuribacterales bacterium]